MKAKVIVNKLLEADPDPDDVSTNFERYSSAIYRDQRVAEREAEVLKKFKASVRAYLRWLAQDMEDIQTYRAMSADILSIHAFRSFDQVLAVLQKWEDPEARFLYMIQQGYFV